jgi:hypothetical protein
LGIPLTGLISDYLILAHGFANFMVALDQKRGICHIMTYKPTSTFAQIIIVLLLVCLPSFYTRAQTDSSAGKGLNFNGSTQFVDTRFRTHLRKFTAECWVKSPNAPTFNQGKGPVHYEENFQFNWDHVAPAAQAAVVIRDSTGSWQAASFGTLLGSTWYHLAATYDGDTLKAYVNGRLITANGAPTGPPKQEFNSLKIGKHAKLSNPQYEFFEGVVDEVRVWNVALPADSIRLHIHHPLRGNEPGLVLYYQLNELQGDSTLNLVSGRMAPLISRPQRQAVDIPVAIGYSTLVNAADTSQTYTFFGGELKAKVDAPTSLLMATRFDRVLQNFIPPAGSRPRPYIINYYDGQNVNLTSMTITEQQPRLANFGSLRPGYWVVGHRRQAFENMQNLTSDSVLSYDSTAGIYQFRNPKWGQLILGLSTASPVRLPSVSARQNNTIDLRYDHQDWVVVGNYGKLVVLDQLGRVMMTFKSSDPAAGIMRMSSDHLPIGLYHLIATDLDGQVRTAQMAKW